MTLKNLTVASIILLGSSAAIAADQAPLKVEPAAQPEVLKSEEIKTPSIFEKLDQNKDGKVSAQEAQVSPALVKSFDKIDSNKDGFLSQDEFSQLQVKATTATTFIALATVHNY